MASGIMLWRSFAMTLSLVLAGGDLIESLFKLMMIKMMMIQRSRESGRGDRR
jgi:hypothetical protein